MKQLANIISYLFHPIFAPLISVYLLFQLPIYINFKIDETYRFYTYSAIVINLIVAPALISLYLKRSKIISSLKMPTAKERWIPYAVSIGFFTFTYFLFEKINFPKIYLLIFGSACLSVVVLLILALLNVKASAHLCGIGGICGLLVVTSILLNVNVIAILIGFTILAGIVGSARTILKAHSLFELFLGFLVGFGLQLQILL